MERDVVVPAGARSSYDGFHFAPAVRHGGLLICSGQLGLVKGAVPEQPEEEFRQAWRAVGEILEEAGLDYGHILEYTTYHVGLSKHLQAFMAVRDEFLAEPWPAWTAIGVSELAVPGARVEVRVTAAAG